MSYRDYSVKYEQFTDRTMEIVHNKNLGCEAMIDINEALAVYLGTDDRGGYMPVGHEMRLEKHYGDSWEQAMNAIQVYLQFDYTPDWSENDLNSVADAFTEAVSSRFPELSANVARALGNRFSYGWR